MTTENAGIREYVKWALTEQWNIVKYQAQKVVAVVYRRWSFTRGSNCNTDWENFGVLDGGRLWDWSLREVVTHGGVI